MTGLSRTAWGLWAVAVMVLASCSSATTVTHGTVTEEPKLLADHIHTPVAVAAEAHGEEANHEAAHGAHGEGGHGHHGGHHQVTRYGIAVAAMLLGVVGFIMALFYLTNWYDKDIQLYTWKMISATVSIFLAVLIFSAIETQFHKAFDPILKHDPTGVVLFLILWAAGVAILSVVKADMPAMLAQGSIWGHIAGFAAISAFFTIQETAPFDQSPGWNCLIIPIFVVFAGLLMWLGMVLRKQFALAGDGVVDRTEERWFETSEEMEDDMACLALSFITCAAIRYRISGAVPSAHGSMGSRSFSEAVTCLIAGAVFMALAMVATCLVKQQLRGQSENEVAKRAIKMFQTYAAMTMAWLLYFGSQWLLFAFEESNNIGPMVGKLILAMAVSVVSMGCIFILDCICDGGQGDEKLIRSLISAMGVLVGISWESTFSSAVQVMADISQDFPYTKLLVAVGLIVFVMPAWRLYILPKADDEVKEFYAGKNPPLSSIFCRWDPTKDACMSKREMAKAANGVSNFTPVTNGSPRSFSLLKLEENAPPKGCAGSCFRCF